MIIPKPLFTPSITGTLLRTFVIINWKSIIGKVFDQPINIIIEIETDSNLLISCVTYNGPAAATDPPLQYLQWVHFLLGIPETEHHPPSEHHIWTLRWTHSHHGFPTKILYLTLNIIYVKITLDNNFSPFLFSLNLNHAAHKIFCCAYEISVIFSRYMFWFWFVENWNSITK